MTDLKPQEGDLSKLITQIRKARSHPKKLKSLIEKYEREFGSETEKQVLDIIADTTRKVWAEIANRTGKNDIDGILDTLWKSFEEAGGEFTVERTENSAQIHCTKCPIADSYLEIGKPEYGLMFHCSTDPHIVAGFNPEMEFKITKRIMSGNSCCDHYYRIP
ncbi:MAG: L-2-amino-thiazoline-4-carboxylic acid hydrolase [Candidatus Thorarchaeota archaeon]